jgi:hypothetical protein
MFTVVAGVFAFARVCAHPAAAYASQKKKKTDGKSCVAVVRKANQI